jgi:sulfatase modifying factor 1
MSDFDPYHIWLGIPETERPISKYRLLAIADFENNREVISAAAERQTIYLRTLQAGEHEVLVADLLNEVSQARVTLLNAEQKAAYDEELRKQQTPDPVPEPTPPPIPVVQTLAPLQNTPLTGLVTGREPITQNRPQSMTAEWSTFQPDKRPRRRGQKEIWKRPAVIGICLVGTIFVFVLLISLMSSGDAEPVASNTAAPISAERAVETAVAEKTAAEKAAAITSALATGDWKAVLALYPNNSEGLRMKAVADKAVADKAAMEKAAMEKAAMEKAAMEKAAVEKAAMEKAAMEKAAAEKKAAMVKVARDKAEAAATKKAAEEVLARAPITNTIGMTLNKIPAGTFMIGSPESEPDREIIETQPKVTITNPFYMQTTEVTQGQWKAVMGTEPWKGEDNVKEGATYPATNMDWDESVAYCKKLSAKESKTYRLPTEAEWEYACRVGTKTTWSSGDDQTALGDYAWCDNNTLTIGEPYAHQVGLKKPNAFGLYDMHGNAWEWCSDYYGPHYYIESPQTDPQGPARGSFRVLRGGSWSRGTRFTRSANRVFHVGIGISPHGFRLDRELD